MHAAISSAEFEAFFAGQTTSPGATAITLFNCRDHLGRAINLVEAAQAALDLNRKEARFRDIVTAGGKKTAAGIEAVAFNSVGGATGSLLKLVGDNVIAEGTLSANALIVGLGGNLLQDPSFDDGFAHWIAAGNLPAAQRQIGTRGPGVSYSHPGWPTLMIYQTSGYADGDRYGQILHRPVISETGGRAVGVPVTAGKTYIASAYCRTLRCVAQLYIYWYDSAGTQLALNSATRTAFEVGAHDKPDSWRRAHLKAVAPDGAAYATISFVKRDTLSGQANSYLFIWKPQLEEAHAEAIEPSPWSPGGTTYINGGRLFSRSIQTRHLDTDDLAVAGLAIFNGSLQSGNFNLANGAGWQITNAGVMNMPHAIVRTLHLADGTVTLQWSTNSYSLTISLSYAAKLMVFTSARIMGTFQTHTTQYKLTRNGANIETMAFSVDEYTNPYLNMRAINVAAGTHTFEFSYTRIGGANTTTQHNTPRLAIFGAYR